MSISLVAGLGNPGREYEHTRHNLGAVVVNALASKHGLSWKRAGAFEAEIARWNHAGGGTRLLVKPLTFMNDSGRAISELARFHRIDNLEITIVYDDLTIDLGLVKVTVFGSAGGHNGVSSVLTHIGDGFARFRLGIGPKQPAQMDMADFVLGKFTPEQQNLVTEKLDQYVAGLELLLDRGVEPAMNQLNRRDQP